MLWYRLVFSLVLTTLRAWTRNFSLLHIQGCSSRLQSYWYLISLVETITFLCFYFTVTASATPNNIATDHPLSSLSNLVCHLPLTLAFGGNLAFSYYNNTKNSFSPMQTDNSVYCACCFCNNNN